MPLFYEGSLPNNVPKKPKPAVGEGTFFPRDLVQSGRNFYMVFKFVKYNSRQAKPNVNIVGDITSPFNSLSKFISDLTPDISFSLEDNLKKLFEPSGTNIAITIDQPDIILPIPSRLIDLSVLNWEQRSVLGDVASIEPTRSIERSMVLNDIQSAQSGARVNPGLYMVFKQPNFKEYTFAWDLVAHNEAETEIISDIVHQFKYAAAPAQQGLLYEYPSIVLMKLYPADYYTFVMKPAAITGVSADYTGAGQPAFNRNGAPVHVKLQLSFKEIQIWEKNSFPRGSR
tara:strand:- start:326 stop:1180 length:855 start_codon:yes stop_codon:yes gene_type:complete